MGIKHLNRFFKENCKESIQMIHFSKLSGKVIVIDTSIYIYKFVSENALIENIYLLLSIFKEYGITPIFVFDGRPPDDKLELLKQRKHDKLLAEQEYETLMKTAECDRHRLIALKKQFTYITKQHIADVKAMIHAFNAQYIEAPSESDEVCAHMVLSGDAYAVMSEDMDMFVYGCQNVLRYTSLLNHTTVLYELDGILTKLGISQTELREICVLSGTDYNVNETDLFCILKLFKKYHKQPQQIGFYNWLRENKNINDDEHDKATRICKRFEVKNMEYEIKTVEKCDKQLICRLLADEGFLFPIKTRSDCLLKMVCS